MRDDVEAALEETLAAMRKGAHPLLIPSAMAEEMKQRYRKDYQDNATYWPDDKRKILILARIVGSLAEFLTRAWRMLIGAPAGNDVDGYCLYVAGYLVSRSFCPPPGEIEIRGRHCKNYPGPGSSVLRLIAWLLKHLIRLSGFQITRGPLTSQGGAMSASDPIVEERLTQVVTQIDVGSRKLGLTLPLDVANNMRGRYRHDFEDTGNMTAWPNDEKIVLKMALFVGELAAVLTKGVAVINNKPEPTEVTDKCADWAGFVVSHCVCPLARGTVEGRHCRSYEMPS